MDKRESLIYSANQEDFLNDVRMSKLADKMKENFEKNFGRKVNPREQNSWNTTGEKIKNIIELAKLKNIYVCFEYQIPYNQKRIDCLLFGKSSNDKEIVLHIEMKQWENVEALEVEGNFKVNTYVAGANRNVAHPSQQVEGYHQYLTGFLEVFENDLKLFGCSYCPNYNKKDEEGLFNPIYKKILESYPIYTKTDILEFSKKLNNLLSNGDGLQIFNKFMQSKIKPSKKLLESASNIVKNSSDFSLLNDQITARNSIFSAIRKSEKEKSKNVVIIKGGPGTGKTVIALHILAHMAEKKKKVFFSSKSKSLIESLRYKINNKLSRILFTNLNPFVPNKISENDLDVLIVDEAHRIQKSSNFQFTKANDRTNMPQIEQLIRCAKTSIFFIDDNQTIRSLDIGTTDLIKETAKKYNCNIIEQELVSQFRCNGSNNYLEWLESVLGYTKNKINYLDKNKFDFKIIDSPKKLYEIIKSEDSKKGKTARLVAGFCWKWSKELDENKELIKDVKIGDFEMPWETHDKVGSIKNYVKWHEWAYKPEGIKQVGCIYTTQGFEFDYIGVIVGPDLKYDKENDCLIGNVEGTKDPMLKRNKINFDNYVRNIYRVLMTRGLKGCYVYFVDKEVEKYFKLRM